jgi:hypothetical protein
MLGECLSLQVYFAKEVKLIGRFTIIREPGSHAHGVVL